MERTGTRTNRNTKLMKLPGKFRQGFLKDFDERTIVFQQLNSAYVEVMDDLGGINRLSHIQTALVERFIFLEFTMRNLEKEIAENQTNTGKLLGRWVQSINSLSGLAKTLGLERRAKQIDCNLKDYIDRRRKA
ncbi:MAG: hypothetical protein JXB29_09420 [Sedimentisphaerales bacterium]|nr:hypothetical protein [Sedimentisphaerales bacterium]